MKFSDYSISPEIKNNLKKLSEALNVDVADLVN